MVCTQNNININFCFSQVDFRQINFILFLIIFSQNKFNYFGWFMLMLKRTLMKYSTILRNEYILNESLAAPYLKYSSWSIIISPSIL